MGKVQANQDRIKARLKTVKATVGVLTTVAAAAAAILFKAGSIPLAIFTVGFGVFGVILIAIVAMSVQDILAGKGKYWNWLIKVLATFVILYFLVMAVAIGPAIVKAIIELINPTKKVTSLPVFPQIQNVRAHTLPNGRVQLSGIIPRNTKGMNSKIVAKAYSTEAKDDNFPGEVFPEIAPKTGVTIFEFPDRSHYGKSLYLQLYLNQDGADIAVSSLQKIDIIDQ